MDTLNSFKLLESVGYRSSRVSRLEIYFLSFRIGRTKHPIQVGWNLWKINKLNAVYWERQRDIFRSLIFCQVWRQLLPRFTSELKTFSYLDRIVISSVTSTSCLSFRLFIATIKWTFGSFMDRNKKPKYENENLKILTKRFGYECAAQQQINILKISTAKQNIIVQSSWRALDTRRKTKTLISFYALTAWKERERENKRVECERDGRSTRGRDSKDSQVEKRSSFQISDYDYYYFRWHVCVWLIQLRIMTWPMQAKWKNRVVRFFLSFSPISIMHWSIEKGIIFFFQKLISI